METQTFEVIDQPGIFHIPGQGNMQITLCGFVDVGTYQAFESKEKPCNCIACSDLLRKVKALRFPKYYFGADSGKDE